MPVQAELELLIEDYAKAADRYRILDVVGPSEQMAQYRYSPILPLQITGKMRFNSRLASHL